MPTVLLFSGGQDSFLSAIKLLESNHSLHLLTCDNGCMKALDNVQDTAKRLQHRFPNSDIQTCTLSTISEIAHLKHAYINIAFDMIVLTYPNLTINQITCLTCHTAMIISALKYCKKHSIYKIAEGARESQLFSTQQLAVLDVYRKFLQKHNIELLLPVFDIKEDYMVKMFIADRGIVPKLLEAQCYVGYPMQGALTPEQINDSANFLENILLQNCDILLKEV